MFSDCDLPSGGYDSRRVEVKRVAYHQVCPLCTFTQLCSYIVLRCLILSLGRSGDCDEGATRKFVVGIRPSTPSPLSLGPITQTDREPRGVVHRTKFAFGLTRKESSEILPETESMSLSKTGHPHQRSLSLSVRSRDNIGIKARLDAVFQSHKEFWKAKYAYVLLCRESQLTNLNIVC